jgi:hypothetical protein
MAARCSAVQPTGQEIQSPPALQLRSCWHASSDSSMDSAPWQSDHAAKCSAEKPALFCTSSSLQQGVQRAVSVATVSACAGRDMSLARLVGWLGGWLVGWVCMWVGGWVGTMGERMDVQCLSWHEGMADVLGKATQRHAARRCLPAC